MLLKLLLLLLQKSDYSDTVAIAVAEFYIIYTENTAQFTLTVSRDHDRFISAK